MSQLARQLSICLQEHDARLLISALQELEAKWQQISQSTSDEDERAEYGNDLLALGNTKDRFLQQAIATFGESVTTFDRTKV